MVQALTIERLGEGETYRVVIEDRGRSTTHQVVVTQEELRRYAPPHVTPEQLLHAAFEFLLEREPATAILSRFELPVIERYFPDFPDEIRNRL